MTAIYGFTSRRHGLAVLAADDLEVGSGGKADKVIMVGDRYAVGLSGNDAPAYALRHISYMSRTASYELPGSAQELLSVALDLMRPICRHLLGEYGKLVNVGKLKAQHWDLARKQSAVVAVVDCSELLLAEANLGKPYGRTGLADSVKLRPISDGLLYRGGVLQRVASPTSQLPREALEDPISYLSRVLASDKRGRLAGVLGDVGAVAVSREGVVEYHSTFGSPTEYTQAWLQRTPQGFMIEVADPGPAPTS